jgi:hypothetical protein
MMVVLMAVILSVAAGGNKPKVSNGPVFHPAAPGFAPAPVDSLAHDEEVVPHAPAAHPAD